MALKEWNANVGNDKVAVVKNASVTAVTGGAANLGGTIAVRLLVDDTVAASKMEVNRAVEAILQRFNEDTYPPA